MQLPTEIVDKILLYTGDMNLAIGLKNDFIVKKLYNPEIHTWEYSSKNGDIELIKWLHENRTKGCSYNTMNWAAGNGHLEIVKFLHENRTEGCSYNAMNYAAHNGHR